MSFKKSNQVPRKFRPRSKSVDNDGYESGYQMIPSSVNSSRTSLLDDNTHGAVFKYDSESDWETTGSNTGGPKYPTYLIKALRLQHEKSNLMPKTYRNYHAVSMSQLSTASSAPELHHLLTIPEIHEVFGFRVRDENGGDLHDSMNQAWLSTLSMISMVCTSREIADQLLCILLLGTGDKVEILTR
uniref:Uncharacterized protein n=1 Tax=Cacopsylla melanoneura TaxID=428564 RepID=A0A8D9ESX3_9HEMI